MRKKSKKDKTPGLLHPLPIPDRVWQHLSMDFKSMPMCKKGLDNALVVVDRLSKQPVTIPCRLDISAEETANLLWKFVFSVHGIPSTIVSDRGPQFVNGFWTCFCNMTGIQIKLSTVDHPQTDGQTEIQNAITDQRLRFLVDHHGSDWDEKCTFSDFSALVLPHATLHMSPYEVLHNAPPRTSIDSSRLPEGLDIKPIDIIRAKALAGDIS